MPFEIKIDSAQFVEIEKRIRDDANQILSGSALKQEIGDFAVDRIKYQARTGAPYNSLGVFPGLKDSTIRNRRYLAKYNQTHDTFSPEYSNLTITGELLDSLKWSDEGNCLLKLEFDGIHSDYNSAHGNIDNGGLPNATLVEYLAAKGFFIFDMSLQDNKTFVNRIKNIALGYIRRGLRIRSRLGSD